MRIVLSVPADMSRMEGTSVRAKRVSSVLSRDYKIEIVDFSRFGKVRPLLEISLFFLVIWWLMSAYKILKFRKKIEVVYCSNDWFGFFVYYTFSKIFGYHIIFEAHSILSEEYRIYEKSNFKIRFLGYIENFVISRADIVIALAPNIRKFYRRRNSRTFLISLFLDEKYLELKELKLERNIGPSRAYRKYFKIGMIGPFDAPQNLWALEFLYSHLDKFIDVIKFIIIGKVSKKRIHKKLVFTGYLPSEEYFKVLASVDAFLVPVRIPTLGPHNKILEPMHFSKPVITTPKGLIGLCYVTSGKEIFVFEPDEIIRSVNALAFNKKCALKVGIWGNRSFKLHYSYDINSKKLLEVVKSLGVTKNGY